MQYQAFSYVAEGDFPTAPKPTPTARPSRERERNQELTKVVQNDQFFTWYIMYSDCYNK